MGLNACSCLRSFDDLSAESDLNGDGEIIVFNIPNNNHFLFSSTDDILISQVCEILKENNIPFIKKQEGSGKN